MWYTFASHLRDARVIGRLAVLALWRREIISLWRGARRARVFEKEQRKQNTYRTVTTINWFGNSTFDFRLGVRMLRRYPGLTVIGVFARSIAIGISAGAFEFHNDHLNPKLPLDDAERILGLWNWDVAEQTAELQSFRDYLTWAWRHMRLHSSTGTRVQASDGRCTVCNSCGW